jgi:transposase-like protein
MANQPRVATERTPVLSAFQDGGAVAMTARRTGVRPGLVHWLRKKAKRKGNDRKRPINRKAGDFEHGDPAQPLRQADLAFQRAMRRAVAEGREHPPMIGVFKDARRLDAPRLFDPVPPSSGCTSPALVCFELEPCLDRPIVISDET